MSKIKDLLIVNEFHPETLARLDSSFRTHHLWQCNEQDKPAFIASLDGHCRAAATGSWTCDPITYSLQSLELIAAFGVGVDGIDLVKARENGIRVTNTPGVLNDAVADIALALILAVVRDLVNADHHTRSGAWLEGNFPVAHDLAGKTLGIVGLGRIGEAIVSRALPFKLEIAYHNRSPKNLPYTYYPSIRDLAAHSDILLCMLPGGDETRHAIDRGVFENLGPDGYFINVGRGSCVDEEALISALSTGQIAGAGLDVYAQEPGISPALRKMNNAVLLPHIGSGTIETRRAMGDLVIQNLEAYFAGKALLTEVS